MFDLDHLAARVRTGDVAAAAELREELETQLVPIVRRAMGAPARSPLARRIRAEAAELDPEGGYDSRDHDGLIGRVARRLCASLLEGLQPGSADFQAAIDTVRN